MRYRRKGAGICLGLVSEKSYQRAYLRLRYLKRNSEIIFQKYLVAGSTNRLITEQLTDFKLFGKNFQNLHQHTDLRTHVYGGSSIEKGLNLKAAQPQEVTKNSITKFFLSRRAKIFPF